MDMLQQGADFLSAQRHRFATRTVTYWRGDDSIPSLQATPGPVRVENNVEVDVTLIADLTDWIFRKSDLVLSSTAIEPAAGDQIEVTFRGVTTWYEALPIIGEAVYRETELGNDVRIHTKEIATPV